MRQPQGFIVEGQDLVCKLKRSIYGLKQSPRCWNHALHNQLTEMGFVQTASDPCLYVAAEGEMVIVAVYVDDIAIAARSDAEMADVKKALAARFEVRDMGELHYFLGVKVVQSQSTGEVWIGQGTNTKSILQKFGINRVSTLVDPSVKLVKDSEECKTVYQSAVGSLLYLSTRTRPDITYAVSCVAKFCAKPTRQHWSAVKRIMRYLIGTVNFGLLFSDDGSSCVGYSDANIGVAISETENQHQDTYFRLAERQSAGRVTSRHVWRCQLLKQSIMH